MLYEALTYAIGRNVMLRIERKRNTYYFVVPEENKTDALYASLKTATRTLSGIVSNTRVKWSESLRIKIVYKLDRLWLLVTPLVWLDRPKDSTTEELDAANEFVRERLATRYNSKYNEIIDAWISILVGDNDTRDFTTFGIQDGADASFTLSRGTAFSSKER